MGMKVDISDFERGFKNLVENSAPEAIGKGMFKAAGVLLDDAIRKSKTAPKDVGDLWGSAQVDRPKIEHGKISIVAGFNIAYAAKWHELPPDKANRINWTRDKGSKDPGPKYLESKMAMYAEKYLWITGEPLRNSLGG